MKFRTTCPRCSGEGRLPSEAVLGPKCPDCVDGMVVLEGTPVEEEGLAKELFVAVADTLGVPEKMVLSRVEKLVLECERLTKIVDAFEGYQPVLAKRVISEIDTE